ncbi:MarR family winged helix-turn-helix transcriptional regulator [Kineococcus indalonis]|uniref:MarR family winged helix-turn-helix transcriptional regulator n=1 Tax=Kineococcus indalonis TaxID=2696566 RepID=UPI0014120192|nr:MarR family winged helix-turn-helix transcriptional regulator [Kineococcus indalonis]NAZ85254.1 MarR family transcriptional regulator [Kineococcus indalonis]
MDLTEGDIDALVTWSLIRAAHRAQRELTAVFAEHGLSPVQFGVLSHLATGAQFTQAQLARAVLVRPQSMSGVLDGMVGRGLITRGSERSKGRRNPLALTGAGRELLAAVWPAVREANRPERLGMSAAEVAALNGVLLRMVDADS